MIVLGVIIELVLAGTATCSTPLGLCRLHVEDRLHVGEGLEELGVLCQLLLDEGLPIDIILVQGFQDVHTREQATSSA